MEFLFLIFDNVRRNVTRTILTSLGTMMLVIVVTGVWSILEFLDNQTRDKTSNIKAIVTERWRLPSQMPYAYAHDIHEGAAREPGDIKPQDYMTWTFYGAGLSKDLSTRNFDEMLFAFCMEPEKMVTMMDDLDNLRGQEKADFDALVEKMQKNDQGIIIGKAKLKQLNKQVGERITLYSFNYKEIDLEVEILGTFPGTRYDLNSVINIEYFNRALFDDYPLKHQGKKHEAAEKSLNLVFLKMPDKEEFGKVASQITDSPTFADPALKVETASSAIGSFLSAYRDIFWAARYLRGDLELDQHQRARAAHGVRDHEGHRLPPLPDSALGAGRVAADRRH
jgi:putative ABC transport system permease protein